MQRFQFIDYEQNELKRSVWDDEISEYAAVLVGEIRDVKSDMPLCFVHSRTTGLRITAALNALEAQFTDDSFNE